MTAKKLVFAALLAVMSLTLYVIEGMIPPVVPIPGFRIGLAYFPVLFSLYLGGNWSKYDTALILITRVLLSALISGNLMALLFSLTGGALSFTAMAITRRFIKETWGVFPAGIFSAVMHASLVLYFFAHIFLLHNIRFFEICITAYLYRIITYTTTSIIFLPSYSNSFTPVFLSLLKLKLRR